MGLDAFNFSSKPTKEVYLAPLLSNRDYKPLKGGATVF